MQRVRCQTENPSTPRRTQVGRARVALVMLVAADVTVLVALHGAARWASVDWLDRSTWTATSPEVVAAAAVRLAALGAAYWVAAVIAWAVLTHRRTGAARAQHWTALPGIRRLVDRALAVGLAASTLLAPATASALQTPPIPVIVESETLTEPQPAPDPPAATVPVRTASTQLPRPLPEIAVPAGTARTPAAAQSPAASARTHTVQPGEHMWLIAARHLESMGAPASDSDVAPYWVRMIDANCAVIRSGDPDLIYPGEVLTLPEVAR